jgi:hypothetical protein
MAGVFVGFHWFGVIFPTIVKWITFARTGPGNDALTGWRQADFNIRAGQGRMGVILRRRPCFFAGIDRAKAT